MCYYIGVFLYEVIMIDLNWIETDAFRDKFKSYYVEVSLKENDIFSATALLRRDNLPFYECVISTQVRVLGQMAYMESSMNIRDLENQGLEYMKTICLQAFRELINLQINMHGRDKKFCLGTVSKVD